jgi:S1-C subfamily serine protease
MKSKLLRRFIILVAAGLLLAVVSSAVVSGYRLWLRPSDQSRHRSFEQLKKIFAADQQAALRQTYFVFSTDSATPQPRFNPTTSSFVFDVPTSVNQGLAIALDKDGYLLTAGHVLGEHNFVMGYFDGEVDLKPVRVVYSSMFSTHSDIALLKASGNLNHPATFGKKPTIGDPAFSIGCFRSESEIGGRLDFTAGRVLDISRDPSGNMVDLIDTNFGMATAVGPFCRAQAG